MLGEAVGRNGGGVGRVIAEGRGMPDTQPLPRPQRPPEDQLSAAAAHQRHLAAGAAGCERRRARLPLPLRCLQLLTGGRPGSDPAGPALGRSGLTHAASCPPGETLDLPSRLRPGSPDTRDHAAAVWPVSPRCVRGYGNASSWSCCQRRACCCKRSSARSPPPQGPRSTAPCVCQDTEVCSAGRGLTLSQPGVDPAVS